MGILLVEDEKHKRDELIDCLNTFYGADLLLTAVDGLREAILSVSREDFDLIVLDMALPIFAEKGEGSERGHDQALGGVEVLRALRSKGVAAKIIIVTQHSEVNVDGKTVTLKVASGLLSRKYGQKIIGSLLYKYRSEMNKPKLTSLLKKMS